MKKHGTLFWPKVFIAFTAALALAGVGFVLYASWIESRFIEDFLPNREDYTFAQSTPWRAPNATEIERHHWDGYDGLMVREGVFDQLFASYQFKQMKSANQERPSTVYADGSVTMKWREYAIFSATLIGGWVVTFGACGLIFCRLQKSRK